MSNMKCPFCGGEMIGSGICHYNPDCPIYDNPVPIEVLDLLDRTRKALEIAVDALKEQQRWLGIIRISMVSHLNNEKGTVFQPYDADPTVLNIGKAKVLLNNALEQITEAKGGDNAE